MWVEEDQAVVGLAAAVVSVGDPAEVVDVLCDDRALLALCHREDLRVRERAKFGPGGHGVRVMAAAAELLGDRRRVHLIEQELQASAARARSQAAC